MNIHSKNLLMTNELVKKTNNPQLQDLNFFHLKIKE
jgi:hypothetical protein